MACHRILIVEDDPDISFLLDRSLKQEGFKTTVRSACTRFIDTIHEFQPDLILLDLLLPGLDGYTACRLAKEVQSERDIKVIMLTSKSEEEDVLSGFRCGADDYIVKPFQMREVHARIKAVLRRQSSKPNKERGSTIRQGPLYIDDNRHEVRLDGEELVLTISEFKLLHLLASQPDRVFSRDQLGSRISSFDHSSDRSGGSRNIDVHIRSLRKKLGEHFGLICTLRGVGYYFQRAGSSLATEKTG